MKHSTLGWLLIIAVVIYLPVIIFLVLRRRSCSSAIAIGSSATVVCLIADVILPPVGLIIFLVAHALGLYLWIVNFSSLKRDEDDSLPSAPEEED